MILETRSDEENGLTNRSHAGLSIWIRSVVMAICRIVKGGAEVEPSRFRSGELALLNVLLELRWMTSSGAREFFVDASRGRANAKWLNQARQRQ